jgi:DNA-binding CsgD family transcriptional regulator
MPRFYPEIMVGWKVGHFGTVALWLPDGPVLLSCLSTDSPPTYLGEGELTVLTLLLPALEAGIWMLRSLNERGAAVPPGPPADPPRPRGRGGRHEWLGGRGYPARSTGQEVGTRRQTPTGIRTALSDGGPLRLYGSWLRPGTVGPGPAALVLARGASYAVPDARALGERYGLTPRQSHVARLLALGASNDEIADRLRISPHTARHHAQSVLERIGTHSRKAMGLRFLRDEPACHGLDVRARLPRRTSLTAPAPAFQVSTSGTSSRPCPVPPSRGRQGPGHQRWAARSPTSTPRR